MTEHQRLQKIRDLGFRLQELQLIRVDSGASYASATLNYLFQRYQVKKPSGLSLEQTLSLLALIVQRQHPMPYRRLTADSVLDFFSHRYAMLQPSKMHVTTRQTYRLGAQATA